MRTLLTTLAATVVMASAARADGLIRQLPEDTSWVLFKTEGLKDKSQRGGTVERYAGQLKIASVGTATIEGQKCRWIEIDTSYRRTDEPGGQEGGKTYKLLIPEKHLSAGTSPIEHVHRGWVIGSGKFSGGKPRKIEPALESQVPKSEFGLETQFYLAGPGVDVRPLDPALVESKLGKLKHAGMTGSLDTSALSNPGNAQRPSPTFEIRVDDKAPFGIVSFALTAIEPSGDRVEMKGVLEDFGKTAVSSLPDSD